MSNFLTPDRTYKANGLTVKEFLLTKSKNNPNKIDMPSGNRKKTVAITVHNTEAVNVSSSTTMAEQYTRATYNNAMKTVRVHYYVDNVCAWQNLPDDYVNWSCADGTSDANSGNNTTVAIEVIGNSAAAEANAVKLVAYLLNKYNLDVADGVRSHTYWLARKAGKSGTIDTMCTTKGLAKYCPIYILPHWSTFKSNVEKSLNALKGTSTSSSSSSSTSSSTATSTTITYRVRKTWADASSQIGAYSSLDNAKKACKTGYSVFDEKGNVVYTNSTSTTTTTVSVPDVKYRLYSNGAWSSEITNATSYAGKDKYAANGFAATVSKGSLKYRVHLNGGGWLSWITAYNINDWNKGCAGLKTQQIDAIQIELLNCSGYQVKYRVSSTASSNYYDWVEGISDYAGVFGKPVDKVQIEIIKK
jgi:hypothetical protein